MYRLTALDVTQMMRNSVLMSCFSDELKGACLGWQEGPGERSHVSHFRFEFRNEVWIHERQILSDLGSQTQQQSLQQPSGVPLSAREVAPTVLSSRQHAAAQVALSRVTDIEYFAVTDKRVNFPRIVIVGPTMSESTMSMQHTATHAAKLISRAMQMRSRYRGKPALAWERRRITAEEAFGKKTATFDEEEWHYVATDSICIAYRKREQHLWPSWLPTLEMFHRDYYELKSICDNEALRKFAFDRLDILEHKFNLHVATNHAIESGAAEKRGGSNRDFYHCSKVDTHILMAAGMTASNHAQLHPGQAGAQCRRRRRAGEGHWARHDARIVRHQVQDHEEPHRRPNECAGRPHAVRAV